VENIESVVTPDAGAKPGVTSHSPLTAVVGLLIAFGWTYALGIAGLTKHRLTDVHDDLVGIVAKWLVVLVLCLIAFGLQHLRLSEFGIRSMGWRDALAGVGGTIAGLALGGLATAVVRLPSSLTDLQSVAALPLSLRVGVVLTAAFCEEFMYRGFGIEELALLIRNRWLAGMVSLVFFTLAHAGLYGFSAALIIPGATGAVLTLLYLWRRNLFSCILMHALIDGLFLVLVPAIMATSGK
jgi:membrane protease YdiL (CAAX protease family)